MGIQDIITLMKEGAAGKGFVLKTSDEDLLRDVDVSIPLSSADEQSLKSKVKAKQDEYIRLYITLLNNIHREDVVGYVLAHLVSLVEDGDFCRAFASIGVRYEGTNPTVPFWPLLSKQQPAVQGRSFTVLGAILGSTEFTLRDGEKQVTSFLEICIDKLKLGASIVADSPSGEPSEKQVVMEMAVKALTFVLRNVESRVIFAKLNGIHLLKDLVVHATKKGEHVQLSYEIGVCMWLLSYNETSAMALLHSGTIASLHDILKNFKKEKCARIAILTLKNFVNLNQKQVFSEMVSVGLLRTLQLLSKRPFGDTDVLPEVENLVKLLEQNIDETTSFADYKQEVQSGRLEWSPVHKSEKFWKESIKDGHFDANDFRILRELSDLLKTTPNKDVKAIICHDFGEFVKYHPEGRKVVNALDVKAAIIECMQDQDHEMLRKQALLCVQKIMVQKWEFLSQQ